MLSEYLKNKLLGRDYPFITVATSDPDGFPHASPKLVLKIESGCMYLVDYRIGKTLYNLKNNPKVLLSFIDMSSLKGYRITGVSEVISEGPAYRDMIKEMVQRLKDLMVDRIIEGMRKEISHEDFIVDITGKMVFYKIKMRELVQFSLKEGGPEERAEL